VSSSVNGEIDHLSFGGFFLLFISIEGVLENTPPTYMSVFEGLLLFVYPVGLKCGQAQAVFISTEIPMKTAFEKSVRGRGRGSRISRASARIKY